MSNTKEQLQRARSQFPPPEGVMESLRRRRDRKRRNQRIAAGVVGIAVFVAAVWIVTSVGSSERTQTPATPGTLTGPVERKPVSIAHLQRIGFDIPSQGASTSTPEHGSIALQKGNTLFVYDDGRVIWWQQGVPGAFEQRLTPEGVNLLRSGAVDLGFHGVGLGFFGVPVGYDPGLGLPDSAWEDREIKPYVAARFAVCYSYGGAEEALAPSTVLNLLPGQAQGVLRGAGAAYDPGGKVPTACHDVSTQDARTLDAIFREAGIESYKLQDVFFLFNAPHPIPDQINIWMLPLLPHMDDARDWDNPEAG
jgi:hypothetical protein